MMLKNGWRKLLKLGIGDQISLSWLKDFTYNFDLPTEEISKRISERF